MSKIDDLIAEFCPGGAKFFSILDVGEYVRGITYSKNDEDAAGGISVLRANNITLASNTLNFIDVKRISEDVRVRENQRLRAGDILICAGSGSKEHIGKVAYISGDLEETFGGFMAVIRVKDSAVLEPRFVFHLLTGGTFSKYLRSALSTTTINNLNAGVMRGFRIPVPPLEVQREIVRILDQFTQLEAELEAELEARQRQYEHYRSQLLIPSETTEVRSLGDLVRIRNGRDHKHLAPGDVPVYGSGGIMRYAEAACAEGPSVLIPRKGSLGNLFYVEGPFWNVDTIFSTDINTSLIEPKFLFHQLLTMRLGEMNQAGGVPSQTQSVLNRLPINVPSVEEQRRVVDLLDRFDSLVNDISIGLPAELAARRKQYEYYRDRLLTFEEAAS